MPPYRQFQYYHPNTRPSYIIEIANQKNKHFFTLNANLEEMLTDGDPDIHQEIDHKEYIILI